MRIFVVMVVLLTAAGCDSAKKRLQEAEERYDYVKAHGGGASELCTEARKVRDAATEARDDLARDMASVNVTSHCDMGLSPMSSQYDAQARALDEAVDRAMANQSGVLNEAPE